MTEESPLVNAQQQFADKLSFRSLPAHPCKLSKALGEIASDDIKAPLASPPYARAIVEGYLVNTEETQAASDDSPVNFKINGEINPGDENAISPQPGEGVLVATGSILPDGNFSIVRMWEAKNNENGFSISRPFPPRFFIEEKGCDIEENAIVVEAGSKLTPADIGTLASMGLDEVSVSKRPVVTIFSSGDEVIPHTDAFKPGYIFDCNSPMLSAAVTDAGGSTISGGIQSDDFNKFVSSVKEALEDSDMIVIAGGTAVGGRDFISDLLKEVGELVIDGVQMRSGRPLIMGISKNKPLVCVAGHPPEALRGFHLFGKLAINYMTGHDKSLPDDVK